MQGNSLFPTFIAGFIKDRGAARILGPIKPTFGTPNSEFAKKGRRP